MLRPVDELTKDKNCLDGATIRPSAFVITVAFIEDAVTNIHSACHALQLITRGPSIIAP
jgi:hypothetical protein